MGKTKLIRAAARSRGVILSAAIFAVIFVMTLVFISKTSASADGKAGAVLEKAIKRAVAECYADEGFYPPNIDYLIDNYGIIVDTKKFFVAYSAFSNNFMPDITIYAAGKAR